MASCYHCGTGGASYRRNVNTGTSFGSWVSKRSYGSSSRSYYGLRSLCENCAARVDKWRHIKWTFIYIVIGIIMLYNIFN